MSCALKWVQTHRHTRKARFSNILFTVLGRWYCDPLTPRACWEPCQWFPADLCMALLERKGTALRMVGSRAQLLQFEGRHAPLLAPMEPSASLLTTQDRVSTTFPRWCTFPMEPFTPLKSDMEGSVRTWAASFPILPKGERSKQLCRRNYGNNDVTSITTKSGSNRKGSKTKVDPGREKPRTNSWRIGLASHVSFIDSSSKMLCF